MVFTSLFRFSFLCLCECMFLILFCFGVFVLKRERKNAKLGGEDFGETLGGIGGGET